MVTRPAPISCSAAYTGSEPIVAARHLTRRFLTDLQNVHRLPVSERALDVVELVTNTRKYAPGPSRLHLEVRNGCVEVEV
ncbi:hypothetical protein ACFWUW_04345 [Streptomyces sp. NPDC058655]|uniref:hypothetical protein n=1 Tax=Streptomyces sp. NPDC058655 TaxID=3346577 RepID=UPI0036689C1D